MKAWLSTRTVIGFGWVLVGLGLLPFVGLFLWARTHDSQPISEQIVLQRGQFVSAYFDPELDGTYQVTLYWPKFPSRDTQVDLDWRIVDSQDVVIDQGAYNRELDGANIIKLTDYHPQRGMRQRIIVDVNHEVNGPAREARLEIGIPEVGLELAEGAYPLAAERAAVTTIPGIIILTMVWLWRRHFLKS